MPATEHCEKCGADLSENRVGKRCPRCLLADALSTSAGDIGPGVVTIDMVRDALPQYKVEGLLGQGGMASVFRAEEKVGRRKVALKVLSPETGADPTFSSRFTREAETLARLDHPNIVALYDYGEAEGIYYLAMELVEGETLAKQNVGPHEAVAIVAQVCRALECAHAQGVVHRDIKPGNILVTPDGAVKVADFGLAKLLHEDPTLRHPTLTSAGYGVGTPLYMAPEQREHEDKIDHRADIYALGVVLYELLTGVLPAGHFLPPSKKGGGSGKNIDRVVRRALSSEPERRFPTAESMRTALEEKKSSLWKWAAAAACVGVLVFALTRRTPPETFDHPASSGELIAWGSNLLGDLNAVPSDLGKVVAVTQRGFLKTHTLALRPDGTVVAWGQNTHGQCDVPEGLDGVVAIDAGYRFSVALRGDGTVVCWGAKYGIPDGPLADIAAISANGLHALATRTNGTLVSWGMLWFSDLKLPEIDEKIVAVGSGMKHRVAVSDDGKVIAWGGNDYGQCDVPEIRDRVVEVSCGMFHSLALTDRGEVVGWGLDTNGQTSGPQGDDFVQISAAGNSSAALRRDGSIEVWGWHRHAAPRSGRYLSATAGFLGGYAIADQNEAYVPPTPPVDLGEGELFAQHPEPIITVAVSGATITTLSRDGVRLISGRPAVAPEPPLPEPDLVDRAISPSGKHTARLSDKSVFLTTHLGSTDELPIEMPATAVAVNDAGVCLLGTSNGLVYQPRGGARFNADAPVEDMEFTKNGRLAVAAGELVISLDLTPAGLVEHARFQNHATSNHLAEAPDGTIAVTSGMGGAGLLDPGDLNERSAWLAHVIDGKHDLPSIIATGNIAIDAPLAFSPDGGRLATTGPDRMVRLWDTKNGLLLAVAGPVENAAPSIAVTENAIIVPDGNALRQWSLPANR